MARKSTGAKKRTNRDQILNLTFTVTVPGGTSLKDLVGALAAAGFRFEKVDFTPAHLDEKTVKKIINDLRTGRI